MCVDIPNAVDKNALLSVAKVCRAIANKVCPPYDTHIKGLDCIVGGLVEIQIAPPQSHQNTLKTYFGSHRMRLNPHLIKKLHSVCHLF